MELDQALELAVVSSWEELIAPNESCAIHVQYENVPDLAVNSLEVWTVRNRGYENLVCTYSISRSDPPAARLHFANSYHSQVLADNLDFIMRNQRQFSRPSDHSIHGLVQIDPPSEEDKKRATVWSQSARAALAGISVNTLKSNTSRDPENLISEKEKTAMSDRNQAKPNEEQIRRRAYELFSARGRADGNDLDDWLAAEQELLDLHSSSTQKTRTAAAGQGRSDQGSEADSQHGSSAHRDRSNPSREFSSSR